MTESSNRLTSFVDEKFSEIPVDWRRLHLVQVEIKRVSVRSNDVDLSGTKRKCRKVNDEFKTSDYVSPSPHHSENFGKLNSFEFTPAINLRVCSLWHRIAELWAGKEQNWDVCRRKRRQKFAHQDGTPHFREVIISHRRSTSTLAL